MLALGESQSLEGMASNASEVTYTISGCLVTSGTPPAASAYEVLAQGQLAATAGSLYNPGASNYALISSIHLYNNDTISQTVTLYIEGTAAANAIAKLTIPAGGFSIYEDGAGWQTYSASGIVLTGGTPNVVSSYLISTQSPSGAANITSLTLSPGTWLILGSMTIISTGATLTQTSVDLWLGPNSASATGAYASATGRVGDVTGGGGETLAIDVATVQTFSASTVVYLNCDVNETVTIEWESVGSSAPNATGIIAVQLP